MLSHEVGGCWRMRPAEQSATSTAPCRRYGAGVPGVDSIVSSLLPPAQPQAAWISPPGLAEVVRAVSKLADDERAVVITGEPGTGRRLTGKAIHQASRRADTRLVLVECADLGKAGHDMDLFDHLCRGSSYPARSAAGTLLLSNISRMPRSAQANLLRALPERTDRARSWWPGPRIIATTEVEPESLVRSGCLREDLHIRLGTVRVTVPPLRARRADIPPLAHHFLARISRRTGRRTGWISAAAIDLMLKYDWPGNVAELARTVESAAWLSRGPTVQPCDLPGRVHRLDPKPRRSGSIPAVGFDLRAELESYENELIRQALERTSGNRNQAARLLGINRTTLVEMLKRKRIRAA